MVSMRPQGDCVDVPGNPKQLITTQQKATNESRCEWSPKSFNATPMLKRPEQGCASASFDQCCVPATGSGYDQASVRANLNWCCVHATHLPHGGLPASDSPSAVCLVNGKGE